MSSSVLAPIWKPIDAKATNLTVFRNHVNRQYGLHLQSYQDLHKWSVENTLQFSEAVLKFVGLTMSTPYERVADGIDTMYPPPKWFPGAKLNYAENMLGPGLATRPDGIAVTTLNESSVGSGQDYTFRELETRTAVWAKALRVLGVQVGDRVAAVLPNGIDCLIVLLAAASIGAIFTSSSPDIGAEGITLRYRQVKPVILICDTHVQYAGRLIDLRERFSAVSKNLEHDCGLRSTVVINGPKFSGPNVVSASQILENRSSEPISYEQLPFDHPVYILYSSGTTGTPKCIVHAAGRALLMHKKEHIIGNNLGPHSTLYQYTTTGWMMWNWAVAALSTTARIVLYDGSPLYPTPASQLDLINKVGATHWGTSPKFLAALKQSRVAIPKLGSLQHVKSSGSPLSRELHEWFASSFPQGVGLFSGSGGTDLVGAIVDGNHTVEIYPGEIQGPHLGMKVEIWDGQGRNIEASGREGDLVVTKPFFSMPIGFWGADGAEKYRAAYFEQFPGVWYQGDFIRRNPATGGYEILGRSDGVLNPGGIRFGSAEIYGVIEKMAEVQDCLCVGQKLPPAYDDEQVLLFLKMQDNKTLSDAFKSHVKRAIATTLSARHVPAHIHQVQDIPYTINGKRIENLVRDIVAGKTVGQANTAINPECLSEYYRFALPKTERLGSRL